MRHFTDYNAQIAKVRYVASTLMSREAQRLVHGSFQHDHTYLTHFLHILVKLEHLRRF